MTVKVDRIVMAVSNLPAAIDQYQRLLGARPFCTSADGGEPSAWWGLSNTVIQLVQCAEDEPYLKGLVFSAPDAGPSRRPIANSLGIDIGLCDASATGKFRNLHPEAQCAGICVDHVVLRTSDAQGCIDLFAGRLNVRLALDKTVPEWGGRMLFFRTGKMTLEVIESASDKTTASAFWGLAYQCPSLEKTSIVLGERGVKLSDIREGRNPGTLVATVKSHCLGIPTLLIQPADAK
jgi:catechol 2,3-dioxygenase-like lactoylglutathione lyase family enzyme